MPLPLTVVATGAPRASATAVNSVCASDGPAARDDERPFGTGEQFGRATNGVTIGDRRRDGRVDPRLTRPRLLEHVDRDLDVNRPRTSSGEPCERLGHRRRCLIGAAHPPTPRDELIHGAADVLGLVQLTQVATLGTGGHTGRQQQHRLGLGIRGGGRRHRVGQAGSAGGDHDARSPADPGVRLGRISGTLFVPWRDRAHAVGLEMAVQLEIVGAGNAEDGVGTMCGKGFHDGGAAVAVIAHAPAASTESSS